MSLVAGATLLGGLSHLANLGQFAEIGQAHAYQKEQMQWARRAYCLDSRALRIDLLNAVKEDVRDHHQTYAGRIDTLLLVHTLLLTFALATLQYSDQFVPSSECIDCEEVEHPWMVLAWVYSVSGILILPFWSIVMLIWSKLQLDHWLENALWRLNHELRSTLSTQASPVSEDLHEGDGMILLERVEGAVGRLSGFVVEHQDSFRRIWNRECRAMIKAATVFLWASCVLAIGITAGMFWLFLENHMQGAHKTASTHFAIATLAGLLAPAAYAGWYKASVEDPGPVTAEVFEDCIELPPSIGSTSVTADRDSLDQDRLRLVGRRLLAMGRRAARVIRWNRGGGLDLDSQQPCLDSGGQSPQLWSPMLDEGVSMTDMSALGTRPLSEEGVAWMDLESGTPPDCR